MFADVQGMVPSPMSTMNDVQNIPGRGIPQDINNQASFSQREVTLPEEILDFVIAYQNISGGGDLPVSTLPNTGTYCLYIRMPWQ